MATTAVAISDNQLQAELRQLQVDGAALKKRLEDDNVKLAQAGAERDRIVDGIARGTAKESEVPANKAEIELLEIRIEGTNRLVGENRTKLNNLGQEWARRQGATAQAARQKEFAELKKKGEDLANRILEQLTRLVSEDVPAFDAIRKTLGANFRDMDGEATAIRLREMLFRPPGFQEALYDPNVHLRRLFDRGWEMLGKPGPSYEAFRSSDGGFSAVPGGELSLTVCSLREKK